MSVNRQVTANLIKLAMLLVKQKQTNQQEAKKVTALLKKMANTRKSQK